jgi:hypothetical protein
MKPVTLCAAAVAATLVMSSCRSEPVAPMEANVESLAFAKGGRAGPTGVIYVSSQGLYYDTFAARDPLPMKGMFQLLENDTTEFGPGDSGYLGGRWWVDTDGNGIQDPTDHYFLCPLLGPGRTSP